MGRRPKWSASLANPIAQPGEHWSVHVSPRLGHGTITQVRQEVCKHHPVHVLEVLKVCGDCDKCRRHDGGVDDREQKTAEHAATRSVFNPGESKRCMFDCAYNMMIKPRRAPVTWGGGGGR